MPQPHRPIRIVYVIDKLVRYGGAQKVLLQLVQRLTQQDYHQRIYCMNDILYPEIKQVLLTTGSEVRVIGKRQLLTLIGLWRMIMEWNRWKPDIVFTMLFYSDVIGRVIGKITSVPVIISSIRAKNLDKRKWQFWCDRLTAGWADKVVFNSKETIPFAMKYEGIRPEQVVYIPNGVSIHVPHCYPEQKRAEFGIPPEAIIIGSIGRLCPQKGYYTLLKAFQMVQCQFSDCYLLIVGRGTLRDQLHRYAGELGIAEHIRFLGERTDIGALLDCMDLYVQSSVFEGMPNAVMEAMAAGKPVVATAVDGTVELIEDGRTGWLVAPEQPERLAETLKYVLQHAELAQHVAAAAATHMADHFAVEKMVAAYDALFREVLIRKKQ
jgi:glycosyltransferase involved in cell wall biosynthesis